jgi:hypothetical protein
MNIHRRGNDVLARARMRPAEVHPTSPEMIGDIGK